MGRDDILSARDIEGMIAEGSHIVIFEDHVLKLDSWLARHPGGQLAIKHVIGRDATAEMHVSHSPDSLLKMKAFRIGRKPVGPWTSMRPPIRGGVFRKHPAAQDHIRPIRDTVDGQDEADVVGDLILGDDSAESDSGSSRVRDSLSPVDDRASLISSATSDCDSHTADDIEAEKVRLANLDASNSSLPDSSGLRRRADLRATVSEDGAGSPDPDRDVFRRLSPTEYTDWAMGEEVRRDLRDYPSLNPAVQLDIEQKYRDMHEQIKDLGLYDCPYSEYGKECVRYVTLFTIFMVLLRYEWYLPSALFLGLFWHQIMFTAHDGGHRAITHNFTIDTLIGLFIADFCCGLSLGWWKSSHNVHHLITNQAEHDPDIQNLPFFSTCPSFFKSLHSTYYDFTYVWDKASEILVPYQKYTYYPIMCVARFQLHILSWGHVLSSRSSSLSGTAAWWIRPTEATFMAMYWFIYGYCLVYKTLPDWPTRIAFVILSHMITMPLHVQITLSHWAMSTSDLGEGESFVQRQLRTTLDVDCPAWMDFVHGGLQFQAVHHLFPRLPRHNLRKAQVLVKEFCRETEIPYSILSFVDGNKKVLGRLEEIGEQVSMLINCQKFMAETGESGLH